MHIILHILMHTLHISVDAYCAYSTYCNLHIVHIMHILDEKSLSQGFHCLLLLLLGPPSQGPAVHVPPPTTITTVCWFIAESSGKVSRFSTHGEGYCPCSTHWNKRKASQYGGDWNHIQNLCLFTAFVDNCRLTLSEPGCGGPINKNMQNMQNMLNMTWFSMALVLFQHWNIGTVEVLHACVCLCMDFEQEQKFAEPNVIHPELKSAIRYPRRADKHHVLAIGLLQFPWHEGPRRETHVTLVLSMPDEKGGVQNNMTLVVVGRMKTQSVQQGPILFSI